MSCPDNWEARARSHIGFFLVLTSNSSNSSPIPQPTVIPMAGAGIHPYHQQWPPAAPAPPPPPVAAGATAAPPPHHPPPILVDNPNRPATDEVFSDWLNFYLDLLRFSFSRSRSIFLYV